MIWRLFSHAASGTGVIARTDVDGKVIALGMFTAGYDGLAKRFVSKPADDGGFALFHARGTETGTWPADVAPRLEPAGEVRLHLPPEDPAVLEYSIRRTALGWPEVDVSPPAPERTTGSMELAEL